jgi:hypothetical protein
VDDPLGFNGGNHLLHALCGAGIGGAGAMREIIVLIIALLVAIIGFGGFYLDYRREMKEIEERRKRKNKGIWVGRTGEERERDDKIGVHPL